MASSIAGKEWIVVRDELCKPHPMPYTPAGDQENGNVQFNLRWIAEIDFGVRGELELEIEMLWNYRGEDEQNGRRFRLDVTDKNGALTSIRDSKGEGLYSVGVVLRFSFADSEYLQIYVPGLTWGIGNVLTTGNYRFMDIGLACYLVGARIGGCREEFPFRSIIFLKYEGEKPTAEPIEGEETAEPEGREETAESEENVEDAEPEGNQDASGAQENDEEAPENDEEAPENEEEEEGSESEEDEEDSESEEMVGCEE